jgi:hypothetical protein
MGRSCYFPTCLSSVFTVHHTCTFLHCCRFAIA